MPIPGLYEPSPSEPIADQVALYERTKGAEGAEMQGHPCVILWTTGNKSGKVRKTPLMKVRDGDSYAVIASMGGAPQHPQWFHNVVANQVVTLQDGAHVGDYQAHIAEGEEREHWWRLANEAWPPYDEYQAKTDRVIPVVVLDPIA